MASSSSKSETETAEIASTADPTETITDISSSGEGDKEEEEESENDGDSIVDDGDSTDNPPEYGEDTFSESDYWSPDEDCYSDEEDERKTRLYRRNLYFSHGFLVEKGIRPPFLWSGSIILNSLDSEHSPVRGRTQLQYAQDMANMSLHKYNALKGTDVKLDHVVRVTQSFCGIWTSYITFMARESKEEEEEEEEEEATLVEYQAKVSKRLKQKTYPIFCRPSPKLDPDM